jgi:hypothetical protein
MTEFIAMIYEWFGYKTDLGEHLRGLDVTCSGSLGTDLYLQIFSYMVLTNLVLFLVMYFVIDRFTARFSSKFSWWITALIGVLISFGLAFSLPVTIQACDQLSFNQGDLFMFGLANGWWSLITFVLLTSFSVPRNFSTNCRLTTFWKP